MRSWELAVALDPSADTPVFMQIARAIAEDVRRGRLRRGDPLPGSRTLASSLKVHRNTVLAAYRELAAEGWIEGVSARGTWISSELPDPAPRRSAAQAAPDPRMARRVGFDLRAAPDLALDAAREAALPWMGAGARGLAERPRGTLDLLGGVPDLRLVPTAPLARAYRRALRLHGARLLAYGDPRGHERLRAALAEMLATSRGVAAQADSVIVTRGSQMAIDLVARTLLAPGDVVAVEALGYRPAWDALRQAGARLAPVPVDRSGIRVEALAALHAREPVRAVYVTPHHQYPTTVVLAPGRRLALLELARAARFAIIEDDYDHEFHYDGRPVLPLASADRAGVVVHVGTLSKILAPGLRLGFVAAPEPLIDRIAAVRMSVDRQGDHALEHAVAELIEDGEVQRHARRVRRVYQARRDALVEALTKELGTALSFDVPAGGMALWARVGSDIDVEAWAARGPSRRVTFHTARRFTFDGRARPYVRLGFASLSERELAEAARRMAAALG